MQEVRKLSRIKKIPTLAPGTCRRPRENGTLRHWMQVRPFCCRIILRRPGEKTEVRKLAQAFKKIQPLLPGRPSKAKGERHFVSLQAASAALPKKHSETSVPTNSGQEAIPSRWKNYNLGSRGPSKAGGDSHVGSLDAGRFGSVSAEAVSLRDVPSAEAVRDVPPKYGLHALAVLCLRLLQPATVPWPRLANRHGFRRGQTKVNADILPFETRTWIGYPVCTGCLNP
jgi:hypothetical protein